MIHITPTDMDLRTYFLTTKPADRQVLADAVRAKASYLYLCSVGKRKPGPELCKRIVAYDSRFTLAELRPDIWGAAIDSIAASDDVQPPVGTSGRRTKKAK